ncbi:AfsR family transcriptional regulator, partial [Streptomyces sp. T-3]|nr:AfsR family transcriptional regulator [Streptomyces sp. T-3]
GPDPFAPPVKPAPPLEARSTDAPPPMPEDQLWEARRGVALIQLASTDHMSDDWTDVKQIDRMDGVVAAYRPGLPQTCRMPGSLWFFAVLLTGDPADLRNLLDQNVAACRALGYRWELAAALQMRANVLANRSDWAGDADQDADEALALFKELGDAWGAAEALSARGEALERRGEFVRAGEDFRAAIDYAEEIGATGQIAVLRSRYAGTLLESDRPEEGERILREVIADATSATSEALPAARVYLGLWLGRTGRGAEAREQLQLIRDEFRSGPAVMFEGFVRGTLGWLDVLDGHYEKALVEVRAGLERSKDPLARMIMPYAAADQLATAARALAAPGGREPALLAARL